MCNSRVETQAGPTPLSLEPPQATTPKPKEASYGALVADPEHPSPFIPQLLIPELSSSKPACTGHPQGVIAILAEDSASHAALREANARKSLSRLLVSGSLFAYALSGLSVKQEDGIKYC